MESSDKRDALRQIGMEIRAGVHRGDRGDHELKGAGSWHLYGVVG